MIRESCYWEQSLDVCDSVCLAGDNLFCSVEYGIFRCSDDIFIVPCAKFRFMLLEGLRSRSVLLVCTS
jgi:hypothetical protein